MSAIRPVHIVQCDVATKTPVTPAGGSDCILFISACLNPAGPAVVTLYFTVQCVMLPQHSIVDTARAMSRRKDAECSGIHCIVVPLYHAHHL